MFSKVLVANRGEIAVRIIRACREMGVATVAVYSTADADSLHVSLADQSICIGGNTVGESYLNMDAILSAAIYTGAEAIHPGYGLLSENARFAELCEKCDFAFVGPTAESIRSMGNKEKARQAMQAAGVPVLPGSNVVEDIAEAKTEADRIGYPLLCKSRSGGGGRGIRLVTNANELERAYKAASIEAKSAFGDGGIYLEKYIEPAKHIEVQLLCDNYGNAVCLGERECSMQRKSQKLIEESPSPSVGEDLRRRLIDVSLKAAKAIGYRNAGTIEFILDRDGNFYFMEMNTRLQVEHPITEMVTGIDIVKWQLRIASDARLPFRQEDIRLSGHAIECRINAENPYRNFLPSSGTITALHVPSGPWVRFDSAIYQGCSVSPFYDSMIGKLIVHAADREEAIRKMQASLGELIIEGVDSNIDFQMELLESAAFSDGSYSTCFLAEFLNGRTAAKAN
jgi:acetyl-CoA carboxylase biotin carboxylase subunit